MTSRAVASRSVRRYASRTLSALSRPRPSTNCSAVRGRAAITGNSLGKEPRSPPVIDNITLAVVSVRPMPDEYSVMKPNNGNGNIVQIINKACKLTDRQGDPIAPAPGAPNCTDADVTIRYLEGDVAPDRTLDSLDAPTVAFRRGSQTGGPLYNEVFHHEPAKPQAGGAL